MSDHGYGMLVAYSRVMLILESIDECDLETLHKLVEDRRKK